MAGRVSFLVRLTAAIACPILLALAFPKTYVTPLAFVALAPLFWLWATSSWKQALGWGLLSGTILFLLLDSWMIYSLGDEVGNARFLALILLCGSESIFIAGAAIAVSLVSGERFGAATIFAAPAAWLLTESLRTNGSVSMPFAHLGAVTAHSAWLLPLAAYAGIYGLTAIIALCNGAIGGLMLGADARTRITGFATLVTCALLISVGDALRSNAAIPPPSRTVAIAQGSISQRVKWSPAIFAHTMDVYSRLTARAAARGASIVVWPETAITDYTLQKPEVLHIVQALTKRYRIWLVAGTVEAPQRDQLYNVVISVTPDGTVSGIYRKHYLVPFAEFLPMESLMRRFPGFNAASAFTHGPGARLLEADGERFGPLVCFESAYASYARANAVLGATSLLVVTDDAWFGPTSGPVIHADLAAIDAVSTGRWVVRGADTGISQVIDPRGRIVAELPLDAQDILIAQIGPPIETLYVRYGASWLEILAALGLAGAALLRWRR